MAVTREIFPGYKHSVSAWALLIFRDEMLRQLELDKAGFEVFRRESSCTVFGDEGAVSFIGYCDPIDVANDPVEDHGFEAMQGFHEPAAFVQHWKEVFDRYPGKPSPPVDEIIAGIEYPQQREAFAALIYGSSVEVLRKFFPDSDVASTIMARVRDADYDDEHSDN